MALGAFVAFCMAVLAKSLSLLEPDDFAYRASIIALTHGHIVLTNAQYQALLAAAQPASPAGDRAVGPPG